MSIYDTTHALIQPAFGHVSPPFRYDPVVGQECVAEGKLPSEVGSALTGRGVCGVEIASLERL